MGDEGVEAAALTTPHRLLLPEGCEKQVEAGGSYGGRRLATEERATAFC